ncbi:unnamed protein product [Bursaphelenchus okinawaensis]|uniref:SCP domain-containing protein n=1 Tax=Bursaphelenchus okinawaensis TaxID=465554 RepID=A0A811KXF6_9BILA|nr:unnamed protein product [Bursaphelenchus okinawaensis]CAG9113249.1 unnamed protein product [Bursaphelenchus okinawaensis]
MLRFVLIAAFLHDVVVGDLLSDSGKKAFLSNHNEHRRSIAKGNEKNKNQQAMPKATNMLKMVYNKDLEKKADDWAKACNFEHTPNIDYGQNLFMSSEALSQEDAAKQAGDSWWKELTDIYNTDSVAFDGNAFQAGHFTQMSWAKCRSMGCSVQKCSFGTFVVCNYENGNMMGDNIYESGETCSNCPAGTKCNDGLCAVDCKKKRKRRK